MWVNKAILFAPRTFLETTCFLSQSLCKVGIDIVCDFFVGNGVFHNHCLVCHHVNTIGKRCEIKIRKRSCSNNKDGAHCRKIHKSRQEVTRVVFFSVVITTSKVRMIQERVHFTV